MRKTILIFFLALAFVLAGCNKNSNTQTNIGMTGPIIQLGDTVYLSGRLETMKADGSNKTYIGNVGGIIIGVIGEWIYYNEKSYYSSGGLSKVNINNKEVVKITDDNISEAVIYKNRIYYALWRVMDNYKFKSGLYQIDLDGNEKKELLGANSAVLAGDINISDDWIYYTGESSGGSYNGIYRVQIDGSHLTRICNDPARFLKVKGSYIYYSNQNDGQKLYKIGIDGKKRKKLNNDISWDICIKDNWIYYANNPYSGHGLMSGPIDETKGNIYKIKIDGKKRTKLYDRACRLSAVAGGWIYYYGYSLKEPLYRMKTDGSKNSPVRTISD